MALSASNGPREAIKAERTALINQIRGLLQEFGIVLPQGAATFSKRLVEVLADSGIPPEAVGVFAELRAP